EQPGILDLQTVSTQCFQLVAGESDRLVARSPRTLAGCASGTVLERGEALDEGWQVFAGQRATRTEVDQASSLLESANVHRELDGLCIVLASVAPTRIVLAAQQRQHIEIEPGAGVGGFETAVDAEFGFTGVSAQRQRAEIHEGEADRLLELVGVIARQ